MSARIDRTCGVEAIVAGGAAAFCLWALLQGDSPVMANECETGCVGCKCFTDGPSSAPELYWISSLTGAQDFCHRIWRTDNKDSDCTPDEEGSEETATPVIDATPVCYQNGGVYGEADCAANYPGEGDDVMIECWENCEAMCP